MRNRLSWRNIFPIVFLLVVFTAIALLVLRVESGWSDLAKGVCIGLAIFFIFTIFIALKRD